MMISNHHSGRPPGGVERVAAAIQREKPAHATRTSAPASRVRRFSRSILRTCQAASPSKISGTIQRKNQAGTSLKGSVSTRSLSARIMSIDA